MQKKTEKLIEVAAKSNNRFIDIDESTNLPIQYEKENGDTSIKSRNPSLICPYNSDEFSSVVDSGKCKIPNIYKSQQISEIINKFNKRNNCGVNKNKPCKDNLITLQDIILGGRDQSAEVETHWDEKGKNNGTINCDDVCFCFPESDLENCISKHYGCENEGTCCPYKCSCSDALKKVVKEKQIYK